MKTRVKNTITLPDGRRVVCRIFDAGDEPDSPADRFTIAFKGYRPSYPGARMFYPYLAASSHPYHPQGFGQHGENPQFLTGRHLGARIHFSALPPDVRRFVLQQFAPTPTPPGWYDAAMPAPETGPAYP